MKTAFSTLAGTLLSLRQHAINDGLVFRSPGQPALFFQRLSGKSFNRKRVGETTSIKLAALYTAAFFLFANGVFGQTAVQFTAGTSTWTAPAGVTSIKVEAWGAGGGGGGSVNTNGATGGGGGGGSYSLNAAVAVVPGTTYTIIVGSGGAAGTPSTNGSVGGYTTATFGSTTITAAGGGAGTTGTSGTPAGTKGLGGSNGTSVGSTIYIGGNGADGASGNGGGGGGAAGSTGVGNNGFGTIGGAAKTLYGGAGGNGATSNNGSAASTATNNFGGGGGGAASKNNNGGAGAPGLFIITYTCTAYSISTGVSAPAICTGNTATVTVNSSAANLPNGNYTVTYNLSGGNTVSGATASMTVTGGVGTFVTSTALTNATAAPVNTTITITNIYSGSGSGCSSAIAANNTATITVNPNNAAGAASSTPTLCINTPLTAITHTTTGATGIGTPSGLPAGVTAAWASNTITISGTPAVSGTYSYSIPLTGGCGAVNATGTITVRANNTIALSSASGTDAQTKCINTAITNISYATTGATGATFSGLPAGVTGNFAANTVTISGAATQSGTFNYTVTLTGGCSTVTATGTITVTPASVGGNISSNQSICAGTIPGDLSLTGHTGAVVKWQVANNAGFSTSAPNTVTDILVTGTTISGTTIGALSNTAYVRAVVQNGTCSSAFSSVVTITVNPVISGNTVSGAQTICTGTTPSALSGSLPSGGDGTYSYQWQISTTSATANFSDISSATAQGYSLSTLTQTTWFRRVVTSGTCSNVSAAVQVSVSQPSVGGAVSGSTQACGSASGTLSLSGYTGTIVRWEASTDNGSTWSTISNTTTSLTYTNLAVTTQYRAVVQNGGCTATTSMAATITVDPLPSVSLAGTSLSACTSANSQAASLSYTSAANTPTTYSIAWGTAAQSAGFAAVSNGSLPSGTSGSISIVVPANVAAATYTGTLTVSNANGCQSGSYSFSITVKTTPGVTADATAPSVCFSASAQTTTLGYSATSGSPTTYSIAWSSTPVNSFAAVSNATLGGGQISIAIPAGTAAGTYTGTLVVKNAVGCSSAGTAFTVPVAAAPTIYTVVGAGTYCMSKSDLLFGLSNSETNVSYQLMKVNGGGNTSAVGSSVTGTGASIPVLYSGSLNNGTYIVVARNLSTNCTATMSGSIYVSPKSVPSTLPATVTACEGSSASINVSLVNATSVQWQVSTDGGTTWTSISSNSTYNVSTAADLSSSTLSVNTATLAMNNYRYSVVVGSPSPCGTTTSNTTTLAVNPVTALTSPLTGGATYCQNATAKTLSVSATGGGTLSYQWYSNTVNSTVGATPVGANASSYTPLTATAGTFYHFVVVTGICGSVTSNTVAIVVNATTAISSQPARTTLCLNASGTTLNVVASGTNLGYQWYSNATNANSGGNIITDATAASYAPSTTTAGTTYYYVVVNGTCGSQTSSAAAITVVNPPVIKTQPAAPPTPCVGSTVTLLVEAVNASDVTAYQWYKNGLPISGATSAIYTIDPVTTAASGTYYVMLTGKTQCSPVNSSTVSINPYASSVTTWTSGKSTNDWFTRGNWSCGVPTLSTDAIVPIVMDAYPAIAANATATVRNLNIQSDPLSGLSASLAVNGTLQIGGDIANNGVFDVTAGTIEFAGTTPQTIVAGTFANSTLTNTVQNLVLSNDVSLNGPLNLTGTLAFGTVSNKTFATNDYLTLKSSSSATAKVADLTNGNVNSGNSISGKVTVERFVPAWDTRRYRLATAPVLGTTVNASWQEGQTFDGATTNMTGQAATTTPMPAYGTLITGQQQGTAATANANGFDYWSAIANASGSLRTYVPSSSTSTASWQPVASTLAPNAFDQNQAYLLYVRGDRSMSVGTAPGATTLRAKGELKQGTFNVSVPVSKTHTLLGNPYAAPLDFQQVYNANTASIENYFWVWQSGLGTGTGGYVLVKPTSNGEYECIPGDFSSDAANGLIASGQGFFVVPKNFSGTSNTVNNLVISESNKSGSTPRLSAFRQQGLGAARLYVNLSAETGAAQTVLLDGALAVFGPSAGGNVAKASNSAENLSLYKSGQDYTLSSAAGAKAGDTLQLRAWNLAAQRSYRLSVKTRDFTTPGLTAVLQDNYLKSETTLSLQGAATTYQFSVSADAASKNPLRFRIVFREAIALPLQLTAISARESYGGKAVQVSWRVAAEAGTKRHEVEKSADGNAFHRIAEVAPTGATGETSYNVLDKNPAPVNYYRVRTIADNGEARYSPVVKLELQRKAEAMAVYPNPVTGDAVTLQMTNKPEGLYRISLYNMVGLRVWQQNMQYEGGSSTKSLLIDRTVNSGMYSLEVRSQSGNTETFPVQIIR